MRTKRIAGLIGFVAVGGALGACIPPRGEPPALGAELEVTAFGTDPVECVIQIGTNNATCTFDLEVEVTNVGDEPTGSTITVSSDDPDVVDDATCPTLNPGMTCTVTLEHEWQGTLGQNDPFPEFEGTVTATDGDVTGSDAYSSRNVPI